MLTPSTLAALGLLFPPLAFASCAALPGRPAFLRLERASLAALVSTLLGACAWWAGGAAPTTVRLPWSVPTGAPGVVLDPVSFAVAASITLIAVAVSRYARSGFDRDPRAGEAARWMAATLACTSLLVSTDHLAVMVGAWTGSSLAMHRLLTGASHRPRAHLAAREKFIVGRIAELAAVAALALIAWSVGSLTLGALAAAISDAPDATALTVAAVLLACTAILKSAQLPFHGWITRVMEAPTPVSALLHAGVVNVGGVVLLRVGPLIDATPPARWLLILFGTATAIGAGLVMSRRASVKSRLAWSTVAQMGFMLMQCGLGAWSLALLHLVAHSSYKAHAFLTAGSAVARSEALALARPARPFGLVAHLGVALATLGLTVGGGVALGVFRVDHPAELALAVVSGLGIATLLLEGVARRASTSAAIAAASAGVALVVWHAVFGALVDDGAVGPLAALFVSASFAAAFVAHAVQAARPDGGLARALAPHVAAGLHLDQPLLALAARLGGNRRILPSPHPVER